MPLLQSQQIFDKTKNKTLDQVLADLTSTFGSKSITFPDGTILKWGTLSALPSISANTSVTVTVAFPVQFPTACEYFHAIVTPTASSDFYGVTSLVSASGVQAQFTVRNGATAQTTSGGFWVAIGK